MKTFDELWAEKEQSGPVSQELRSCAKRWFLAGQREESKSYYHGQVEDMRRDNEQLAIALEQLRADVMSVCPENWREDLDWVRLIEAHGLKTPNVEVTGATQLHRGASVLTAGLAGSGSTE